MKFTDIFIKRPVLAMVVSLLIVVLGLRSLFSLPVNQYPEDAERRRHHLDHLLRRRRADRGRLHHAAARSRDRAGAGHRLPVVARASSGVSTITATLRLNYDANRALTEINTQVNSVKNQLPAQAQAPVLTVAVGSDDRRDVHGLLQRHAADQQRHRLPVARRQAEARFDRRRADRRAARRAPVRAACLARLRQAGGARPDRRRREPGPRKQQLPGGARRDQGPDGHGAADRGHRPALRRRVQAARRQAERRRHRAPRGRRHRHARVGELRLQRRVQRRALGLHRHQGGARGEHPRRRQARARGLSRPAGRSCRPASPARSSTTRPSSSTPRSRRSSRRWSRRWSSSRS